MRSSIIQPVDRGRLFSDAELCKALSFCATHEHHPYWQSKCFLIRFVLGLGLRVSEIPPLRIPEDCWEDGFIIVRRSKTGRKRMVKCSPELKPFYLARVIRLTNERAGKLFPGITHKRTLERWWQEVMDAAGVPRVDGRNIHGGRHAYATFEIASKRLDWHEVALQLGHSTPATTMKTYAHAVSEYLYEEDPAKRRPKWWAVALQPQQIRILEKVG